MEEGLRNSWPMKSTVGSCIFPCENGKLIPLDNDSMVFHKLYLVPHVDEDFCYSFESAIILI